MGRMFKPLKLKELPLTEKEKKFVELYDGENLVEAVKGAGYNCKSDLNYRIMGNSLLKKEKIMRAITGSDILQKRQDIADKTERMRFLTAVMRDKKQPVLARLRACELMGKAFGDYVERHEVDVNSSVLVLNRPMKQDTLQLAKQLVSRLVDPFDSEGPRDVSPVVDVEVIENDGAAVNEG